MSATQHDYFVKHLPLYFVALIPGFFVLGFDYMLPRLGLMTIVYVDALITGMFLAFTRFPLALRTGQRARPITNEKILSSFRGLARKAGVENVTLYTVDWKRFKVANAFQVGPRKFSIYISNYLLEDMSIEEVNAVMAHELAHAKKKHVGKLIALFLFPLLVGLNLLILGEVEMQAKAILGIIPFIIGFVSMFVTPIIALRFQKRFELDADAVAVGILGNGIAMIRALQE